MPNPGEIESEFGVPIPGVILPQDQWTRTGIKRLPAPGDMDWVSIFERKAPLILDLGCGNGRFTLLSALARPECDHIGLDLLPVVIRYATRRANQRGLSNVRFLVRDAQSFVRDYAGASSMTEVHLYHPQPYREPGRSHLRLLTPRFLADLHRILVARGLLVIQTDNPEYWAYLERVLPVFFDFRPHQGPWPDAPEGRTRREILARSRGLRIYRGIGTRRDDLDPLTARTAAEALPMPNFVTKGPWFDLDRLDERVKG